MNDKEALKYVKEQIIRSNMDIGVCDCSVKSCSAIIIIGYEDPIDERTSCFECETCDECFMLCKIHSSEEFYYNNDLKISSCSKECFEKYLKI